MKKSILISAIGLMSLSLNAQTWSPCGLGSPTTISKFQDYNGDLYAATALGFGAGQLYRWDGTAVSTVLPNQSLTDICASPSEIYYYATLQMGESATGDSATWSPTATNLGGAYNLNWFNGKPYRSPKGSSSVISSWNGTTWSGGYVLTAYAPTGVGVAKVHNGLLYMSGRWDSSSTVHYGITTINSTNTQAMVGPHITGVQSVADFTFDGTDLYACVQGTGGGLCKLNGSAWTVIKSGTNIGLCEAYNSKIYFTQFASSIITIYEYDPSQALSSSNPTAIATCSSGTLIYDLYAYDNSLYVGGNFTSLNTVASGMVTVNNLVRFGPSVLPAAAFTVPSTVCGLDPISLTSTSTGSAAFQWYVDGTPISTNANTTYTPASYGTHTITLTGITWAYRDSVSHTVSVDPLPTPVITLSGSDLTTGLFSSYQWFLDGNLISSATSQTYMPVSNGNYTVLVTNASGCSDTSAAYNIMSTGINTLHDVQYVLSQHDGAVTVSLGKPARVDVYDMLGKLVYSDIKQVHEIRPGNGVYVVRSGLFVRKIQNYEN